MQETSLFHLQGCFLSVAIARSIGKDLIYGILKYFSFLFIFIYDSILSIWNKIEDYRYKHIFFKILA